MKFPLQTLLFVLILLLISSSPLAADKAVNLSQEIDFGIDIFTEGITPPAVGEFDKLFDLLDKYQFYPVHAHLLRNFINQTVSGSRDISLVKEELKLFYEKILLRYKEDNSLSRFDRSYAAMFLASFNYPEFPSRIFALTALSELSNMLLTQPNNPWFYLFYTVEFASLASINEIDISDFNRHDPLTSLRRALSIEYRKAWFHYVMGQTFIALSENSPEIHQLAFTEFTVATKLAPLNTRMTESIHKIYLTLFNSYDSQTTKKPYWLEEVIYTQLLKEDPKNPNALNNLGFLFARYDTQLTRAVELTGQALDSDPKNSAYLDSHGFALIRSGKIKEGKEFLVKAHQINPEDEDVNQHLCDLHLAFNENAEALPYLRWLQQKDPKNDVLCNNLAYTLTEVNEELDVALKLINHSLTIKPNSPIYLDTKGWIYFKMGMVKEAITTILKAVGKDPRLGALYIHLGDVHFFMGNPEKAIGFYTIGIKLEPDFPGIAETFGKLTAIRALSNRLEPDKSGQYSWQNQLKAPFVYAQYDQILDFLLKQFHTTQPIEPSKKVVE